MPPQQPDRSDSLDAAIPDEPPPAYTPAAGAQGDTHLDAGPGRVDFSGPPPMPDRLQPPPAQHTGGSWNGGGHSPGPSSIEANITGVGVGYGRRPEHELGVQHTEWSNMDLGPNYGPTGHPAGSPYAPRPAPPQHPSRTNGQLYPSPSGLPPTPSSSRPNRPNGTTQQVDSTPTETPTPGRPLLHHGQLLIYPKGHWCSKCALDLRLLSVSTRSLCPNRSRFSSLI